MIFKLAFKDLIKNKTFSLLFILSLGLGFTSPLLLSTFSGLIRTEVTTSAKNIQTSDFLISIRRSLSKVEVSLIEDTFKEEGISFKHYLELEMFSMISFNGVSKFSELRTLPKDYPFYGKLEFLNKNKIIDDVVYLSQDIVNQLKVNIGDNIKVGDKDFVVHDIVSIDTSLLTFGFNVAPQIYLTPKSLASTNLIRPGSTIRYYYHYKFERDVDFLKIIKKIRSKIDDPGLVIKSYKNSGEQIAKFNTQALDYLSLVSLTGIFLSLIGSSFLFRIWFFKHIKSIAILNSLGLTKNKIMIFLLIQLIMLSYLAGGLSLFTNTILFPILIKEFSGVFPLTPKMSSLFTLENLFIVFVVSPVFSVLIMAPFMSKLKTLKGIELFDSHFNWQNKFSLRQILMIIPALMVFYLLCVGVTYSLKLGSIFFGVLFLSSLIIYGLILVIIKIIDLILKKGTVLKRLSLNYYKIHKFLTIGVVLSLSLSVLLLTIIPILQETIEDEIRRPDNVIIPHFFLFDIQPEQILGLKNVIESKNARLDYLTPLIRGRIFSINGKKFEITENETLFKTREEDGSERIKNRVLNLTYRDTLFKSEKIVEGREFDFKKITSDKTEVSLEERFAKRLGVKLGDEIVFDIQDVNVVAIVVSFRKVKWTSFQPNFFVQFPSLFLEDAPKTFLGSITGVTQKLELEIQNEITKTHPNISVVNVKEIILKITKMMDVLALALKILAVITLLIGMLVIMSLVLMTLSERSISLHLLKVLGLTERFLQKMILKEFIFICFFSSILGAILSILISQILSLVLFDRLASFSLFYPVFISFVVIFLSIFVCFFTFMSSIKESPMKLLNEGVSQY